MEDNVLKWIGGKHSLGEFIISKMPPHTEYIEVFMGGGNIFLQKPLATKMNLVNDLNGNLVTMYKVINDYKKKELLKNLLEYCVYSRELFEYFRQIYRQNTNFIMYEDVTKAFIYIYLNRTSFNGMSQSYARRDDPSILYSLNAIIDKMFNKFQAGKTVFEKLPFEELLCETSYKNSELTIKKLYYDRKSMFIYLDPPYWVTTEAVGSAYYEKVMKKSEHYLLKDILLKHKNASWLMSYDDVPEIRHLYGLPINENDKSKVLISSIPGITAILTPETHQSSAAFTQNELKEQGNQQIFKQELLIANYNLQTINTLFE